MAIFQGNLNNYSSSVLPGSNSARGRLNIYNVQVNKGSLLVFGRTVSPKFLSLKGSIASPGQQIKYSSLLIYAFPFKAIFGNSSYQSSTHLYISKRELLGSFASSNNKAEALLFGLLSRMVLATQTTYMTGNNYAVYLEKTMLNQQVLVYFRKPTQLGVYVPTQFKSSDF